MGLVDYASDSDSDSEPQAAPPPAPKPTTSSTQGKKPFQKLLDPSNPGKIIVSLPTTDNSYEPPAKRARTTGGTSSFSGFNSFLPTPKNLKPTTTPTLTRAGVRPTISKPVSLKTGAEAAFSRDAEGSGSSSGSGLTLLPPKNGPKGPTIPEGQKPAEEVKLVGKATMFRPLSVARRPGMKKSTAKTPAAAKAAPASKPLPPAGPSSAEKKRKEPPAEAVSLFSLDAGEEEEETGGVSTGAYEPMMAPKDDYSSVTGPYPSSSEQQLQYEQQQQHPQQAYPPTDDASGLSSLAETMNLTPAQRRELFGRGGPPTASNLSSARIVNVNMDKEYNANEELRASGQAVQHNPLRSIAPGKHSLKQLVNAVQNQREALEDSFAKGKGNRNEAKGRYGW